MKIKFLVLLFFLPIIGYAQKSFDITRGESQLLQGNSLDSGQNSMVKVFIFSPEFGEGLKIKSVNGWANGKEPKYNEILDGWELFVSTNSSTEIKINFEGFHEKRLLIDSPQITKEIITYDLFEKRKDPNAKPILIILSDPPSASFVIESLSQGKTILLGNTPLYPTELSADSVRISLEKEGFYKIDTTLELKKGEQYSLDLKLKLVVKRVEIKTKPFDAKLLLNGSPILNPFFDDLPLGTYNLTVDRNYFHERTIVFNLNKEDSLKTLNIEMSPKLSSITLPTLPLLVGANVFINGVKSPVVNGMIKEVEFGSKSIQIVKNNLDPFSKNLLVDKENLVIPSEFFSQLRKNDLGKKTMKRISVALGVGAVGAGLYLMQSANKNYEAYQKASSSSEAASLRKQVESADKAFPIAFGVGGVLIGIQFLF